MFLAAHAAPRRRRFFLTGGAPPPPTEIDRRAPADTMTSAHSSMYSTGLRVSSPEFVCTCSKHKICPFLQSHQFGKCFHLILLYIIGYNNISWRPNDPHPKIWGRDQTPQD